MAGTETSRTPRSAAARRPGKEASSRRGAAAIRAPAEPQPRALRHQAAGARSEKAAAGSSPIPVCWPSTKDLEHGTAAQGCDLHGVGQAPAAPRGTLGCGLQARPRPEHRRHRALCQHPSPQRGTELPIKATPALGGTTTSVPLLSAQQESRGQAAVMGDVAAGPCAGWRGHSGDGCVTCRALGAAWVPSPAPPAGSSLLFSPQHHSCCFTFRHNPYQPSPLALISPALPVRLHPRREALETGSNQIPSHFFLSASGGSSFEVLLIQISH